MEEICPIHKIEMNEEVMEIPVTDSNGDYVYEEDGITPMMDKITTYSCPICNSEYDELDYMNEETASVEVGKRLDEYYSSHPDFKPLGNMDISGKIMEYLKHTGAGFNPRKSMAYFMISSCLYRCYSINEKGVIRPNLSFIWSDPSGVGKTPVLISGIDNFSEVFKDYTRFETGTAKGMRASLAKQYKKDDKERHPVLVTWDEAQDILDMMKQEALSDFFSFLNQLFDNRIQRYTTIARGDEKYPNLYSTVWLSGVPEILEKTDKNFWYDGAGTRFLFVNSENVELKPLGRKPPDETNIEEIRNLLEILKGIKYADYTDEFLEAYNKYRIDIINNIARIQMDLMASQNTDNFPILSRAKYPVLVWKLSIIHSASRGNFNGELLVMDKQDLDDSIKDLEEYNANMVRMFNYWMEASTKQDIIIGTEKMVAKIRGAMNTILKKHPDMRWTLSLIKQDKSEKDYTDVGLSFNEKPDSSIFHAEKDVKGVWVRRSDLMNYANMKSKDYQEALNTIVEQEHIRIEMATSGEFVTWIK